MGISLFHLWDSNPLINAKTHLFKILEKVNQYTHNLEFVVSGGFQPNLLSSEFVNTLKRCGFKKIGLTLETSDSKRMQESGRPSNISHLERAIINSIEAGYTSDDIEIVLLIDQPGQSLDSVLSDIIKVYQNEVMVLFTIFTPIPQTVDFVNYRHLFKERALEDLDPLLYPFASPVLTTRQIDSIIKYFNYNYFPLSSIAESSSDDSVISRMRELIQQ